MGRPLRLRRVRRTRARRARLRPDDDRRQVTSATSRRTAGAPRSGSRSATRHGVRVQVLSTVPVMFSYWAKPEHGYDVARFLNDDIAETVRKHPKRFVGLGTLPMQSPDLAVRELDRCVNELGLRGVQIGSHVNELEPERGGALPGLPAGGGTRGGGVRPPVGHVRQEGTRTSTGCRGWSGCRRRRRGRSSR